MLLNSVPLSTPQPQNPKGLALMVASTTGRAERDNYIEDKQTVDILGFASAMATAT